MHSWIWYCFGNVAIPQGNPKSQKTSNSQLPPSMQKSLLEGFFCEIKFAPPRKQVIYEQPRSRLFALDQSVQERAGQCTANG
mmetsp:Transcript_1002/g.2534  ORF Transcript_1002/g.2534 Transcript_1002/m.2534 type:complete len:82 (+) Transcript_1002:500-745(+)